MKNTIANANLKSRTVIEDLPVDGDELAYEHLHRMAGGVLAKTAAASSGTVIVMKSYVPASCTRPPIPGFPSDTDDIQVDGPTN